MYRKHSQGVQAGISFCSITNRSLQTSRAEVFPWGGPYYRTNQAIFHNGNVVHRSCSRTRRPGSIKSVIPGSEQPGCCGFLLKVALLHLVDYFLSRLMPWRYMYRYGCISPAPEVLFDSA